MSLWTPPAGVDVARMGMSPYSTFVSLKLGDFEVGNVDLVPGSKDPRRLQSFKIERLGQGNPSTDKSNYINEVNHPGENFIDAGLLFKSAEFQLSSVLDITLESKIIKFIEENGAAPEVTFRYGFVGGLRSPVYRGLLTELGMSNDFYTITIKVSSGGPGSIYTNYTDATWDTISNKEYTKVSDLVTDIANGQGWDVENITETQELEPGSINAPTVNTGPNDYIQTELVPLAVSTKGEGSYKSVFRLDGNGNVKYFFVPTSFLQNRYNYKSLKNYNFIIRMLPNGNVIDFNPTLFNGSAQAYLTALKSDSDKASNLYGIVTTDTKEIVNYKYSISNKSNSNALNPKNNMMYAGKSNPLINTRMNNIVKYGEAALKNNVSANIYSTAVNSKATMTIIGDPELQILDYINVIPMYPSESTTSGGRMHPSGGTYQITGITDQINADGFTTSLQLVKVDDTLNVNESTLEPPE